MSLANRKGRGIRKSSGFEKMLVMRLMPTVPQTDTGGQVEYTKANGKILFKELGKKARRIFGRCRAPDYRGLQLKTLKRLFNKNTGLCKPERGSIGPDA